MVDVIGFAASVTAFVLFLPQAALTWRARHNPAALRGVSVGTQLTLLLNAILWGVYGVSTNAYWVAAPGLINGPLAVLTLWLVMRPQRQEPVIDAVDFGCDHCRQGVAHRIFITEPPGWGSRMPCSEATRRYGRVIFDDE